MSDITPRPVIAADLPTPETSQVDAAAAYIALGWAVVPCCRLIPGNPPRCSCGHHKGCATPDAHGKVRAGKIPTSRWKDRATTTSGEAGVWWRSGDQSQGPNVALLMGPGGLIALDIDGPEGESRLAEAAVVLGELPVTLENITGRGRHLLFTMPVGADTATLTKSIAGMHLEGRRLVVGNTPGFDLRAGDRDAGRSYVAVAPSMHPSGVRYQWRGGPIAELPRPWFDALPRDAGKTLVRRGNVLMVIDPTAPPNELVEVRPLPTSQRRDARLKTALPNILQEIRQCVDTDESPTNNTINSRSLRAFRLALDSGADIDVLEQQLIDAGCATGHPPAAVTATVRSARGAAASCGPAPLVERTPTTIPRRQQETAGHARGKAAAEEVFIVPTDNATEEVFIVPTDDADAWPRRLARTKEDEPKSTYGNVALVIEHAEFFRDLRFNELTRQIEFNGKPLDPVMMGQFRAGIEYAYGFAPSPEQIQMALGTRARRYPFHPVREYLNGLQWDGVRRLDTVASTYLGAANTDLNRAYLRKWFISAVARPMKPGCKVDTALVLIGPQGLGKSTFFAALGGPWFSDTEVPLGDKDGLMMLGSAWLYELGEIDGMTRRAEAAAVKRVLSTQVDRFRAPYAAAPESVPRGVVIVGSTNEMQFLNDPTGSRRFWCVRVPKTIDRSAVARDRDQLWAEAVVAYRAEESWWLSESEDGARAEDSEVHQADDPWEERILTWINLNQTTPITVNAVLSGLDVDISKRLRADSIRVGQMLRKNGYESGKPENTLTGKARVFRRVALIPAAKWFVDDPATLNDQGPQWSDD